MLRAKVEALCKERGITVRELERACGFREGTIWHWNKSVPLITNAQKVAQYFGVSLTELVEEDKDGD